MVSQIRSQGCTPVLGTLGFDLITVCLQGLCCLSHWDLVHCSPFPPFCFLRWSHILLIAQVSLLVGLGNHGLLRIKPQLASCRTGAQSSVLSLPLNCLFLMGTKTWWFLGITLGGSWDSMGYWGVNWLQTTHCIISIHTLVVFLKNKKVANLLILGELCVIYLFSFFY